MFAADRLHRLVFPTCLLAIIVALLTSGCLWGRVTDTSTGAPISGATVSYVDSHGNTRTATTNGIGLYVFDSATTSVPALGPATVNVSATGHKSLSLPVLIQYNENPNASLANLSSFWEIQSFALVPSGTPATMADIAVTDLYADNQPQGFIWVRITNNGPATLNNNKVDVILSETRTSLTNPSDVGGGTITNYGIPLNLAPGQTQAVNLGLQIDTSHYRYDFTVEASAVGFVDPAAGNNIYREPVEPLFATLALTNSCGADITSIQFRLTGDPSWTNMLAFGEVIPAWQTRNWLLPPGTYDLRAYIGGLVLNERLNVGLSGTYDWRVLAALDIWNSPPNWWPIEKVFIYPEGGQDRGPNLLNPGETIPPGGVRRFNVPPGIYMLLVEGPDGGFQRGHHNSSIVGVCAWSPGPGIFDPGILNCVP